VGVVSREDHPPPSRSVHSSHLICGSALWVTAGLSGLCECAQLVGFPRTYAVRPLHAYYLAQWLMDTSLARVTRARE
jgi:hypothetical protein